MNYARIHDKFIEYCRNVSVRDRIFKRNKNDQRLNEDSIYSEKHHIQPTSLGGSNDKSNLIELLPEEHLFIHMIRYKAFNNRIDFLAVRYTINGLNNKKYINDVKFIINKKIKASIAFIKQNKYTFRKNHGWQTKEGLKRISASRKNMLPVKDRDTGEILGSVPNTHPNVISGKWIHTSSNRVIDASERAKRSIANKGENNGNFKYTDEYLIDKIETYLNVNKPVQYNESSVCNFYKHTEIEFPSNISTNKMKKLISNINSDSEYCSRIDNKNLGDYSLMCENVTHLFSRRIDALNYGMRELNLSENSTLKILQKNFRFEYQLYRYDKCIEIFIELKDLIKYCKKHNYPYNALDMTIQGSNPLGSSKISIVKLDKLGYRNYEGLHLKKYKRRIYVNN